MSDNINPDHYKRLPAEAIEIIESAIDNAPSAKDAYLHGQVLKYVLRCWNKNGIEDLCKAKWYLDRLIGSFDASEAEQLATGEVTVEVAVEATGEVKPPDGWRWLEVGEVIRKGDEGFENGRFYAIEPIKLGMTLQAHWMPTIRRNRFEVGEKVVHVDDRHATPYEIDEYIYSKDAYVVKYKNGHYMYHWSKLAPYIEETT